MPPSKLIVNIFVPPKGGFLIRGVFKLRGGHYTINSSTHIILFNSSTYIVLFDRSTYITTNSS